MPDPRAALIGALIQQLYQVERAGADLDVVGREALRQEQALPLLAKIDKARQELAPSALPKSPLGDALGYLNNPWAALPPYFVDAPLSPDNHRPVNHLPPGA